MEKIKNILLFLSAILFSGCYTQLMMEEKREPPKEEVVWEIDSVTGDTVKVIKKVDTVTTKEREICVWRRDLLGYPYLYCYESYYPRDWFYYNYSPWWYRNDPFWYDYYRCPRFYYYDESCGCCRYHYDRSYRHGRSYEGGGGSSEGSSFVPSEPSGSSYKARVRGVPEGGRAINSASSKGESKANNSTNTEQNEKGKIIVSPDKNEAVIVRERGKGVPYGGEKIDNSSPKTSAERQATPKEDNLTTPPSSNRKNSSSSSNDNSSEERQNLHKRNPRSW